MPSNDETYEEWVQRQADAAPPLSEEQMETLARLLRQPLKPPAGDASAQTPVSSAEDKSEDKEN